VTCIYLVNRLNYEKRKEKLPTNNQIVDGCASEMESIASQEIMDEPALCFFNAEMVWASDFALVDCTGSSFDALRAPRELISGCLSSATGSHIDFKTTMQKFKLLLHWQICFTMSRKSVIHLMRLFFIVWFSAMQRNLLIE